LTPCQQNDDIDKYCFTNIANYMFLNVILIIQHVILKQVRMWTEIEVTTDSIRVKGGGDRRGEGGRLAGMIQA
jgi:hypothetical protein